jgi:hypothetical protein
VTTALCKSYTGLRSCAWSLALEEGKKQRRNGEIGRHDNKRYSLVFARLRLCDLASRSNINQNNNVHIGDTCYLRKYFVCIPHNIKYFTSAGIPSLLSLVYELLNAVNEIVTLQEIALL